MGVLIKIREGIKAFYAQFSGVLTICGKFLLAIFVFLFINRLIGVSPVFTNIFVLLVMALLSSILPARILTLFAAVCVLGNAYVLGIDVLAVTVLLLLLLLIMFVWFVPEDAVEVVLMPLGIAFGVPALLPICCGLKRSPASIAAICPGVIMHYYLVGLSSSITTLQGIESKEYLARIKVLTDAFLADRMMVMNLFAVSAVVIIVYAIRKLSADYSWEISVAAGGILYVVMAMISNSALEIGIDIPRLVIGTVISVVISYIFLFFVAHVDYARSEQLTFEDDTYYYYVKAVPKVLGLREQGTGKKKETREEAGTQGEESSAADGAPVGDGGDLSSRLEESLGDL